MKKKSMALYLLISVSFIVLTTGCATPVMKRNFSPEIPPESQIAAKDEAKVKIEIGFGVTMPESEKAELADRIEQKINTLKIMNSREGEKKTYEIDFLLKHGGGRVMKSGQVQYHFEGEITLIELPVRNQVGKFSIGKTSDFSDRYGGTGTTIRDEIAQTIADSVAAAVTGQKEQQNK